MAPMSTTWRRAGCALLTGGVGSVAQAQGLDAADAAAWLPEPQTWAWLVAGVGVVLLRWQRRAPLDE